MARAQTVNQCPARRRSNPDQVRVPNPHSTPASPPPLLQSAGRAFRRQLAHPEMHISRLGRGCSTGMAAGGDDPSPREVGLEPTQGRSLRWGRDRPARQVYVRTKVASARQMAVNFARLLELPLQSAGGAVSSCFGMPTRWGPTSPHAHFRIRAPCAIVDVAPVSLVQGSGPWERPRGLPCCYHWRRWLAAPG
jgi:hypothetical protein